MLYAYLFVAILKSRGGSGETYKVANIAA
jgi:hypothetical protein